MVYKILLNAGPFYLNKLSFGNLSTFGSLSIFYVRFKECSSRECMNLSPLGGPLNTASCVSCTGIQPLGRTRSRVGALPAG